MKKSIIFLLLLYLTVDSFLGLTIVAEAETVHLLQVHDIEILFEKGLDRTARDIANIFPEARQSLETIFEWEFYRNPTILLIRKREDFLKMTSNPLTVAFASPEKNMIVIDHSRLISSHFRADGLLSHELCHILLHQHITDNNLPRWLDEGLCQWASDSIDEMLYGQKQSAVNLAVLSQQPICLQTIQDRFPAERQSRLLAYEASKHFISYLIKQYGRSKVLDILRHLEQGQNIKASVLHVMAIPLDNLEKQWQHTLIRKTTWLTVLGHYIYEILLALMALLSFYAFIRSRIKKYQYQDEDTDE